MRIFHGNRHTEWLLALTVLLWIGASAAFGMPRLPRTGQDSHSKATVKPASTKSSKKGYAKLSAKKSSAKRTRTQMAPTSARISEIQSALAAQGTYEGATTGRWDDATVTAMRRFQSAHGSNPSGETRCADAAEVGNLVRMWQAAARLYPRLILKRLLSARRPELPVSQMLTPSSTADVLTNLLNSTVDSHLSRWVLGTPRGGQVAEEA